jgi:glycosyltransferase involved in cell wall biosynthesis
LRVIFSNASLDDEVIIINDGSTDNTLEILNLSKKDFPNLRIITTKGIGIVKALNLGLVESSHEWIARFDVDDMYTENRINKQRAIIDDGIAAIFCDYELVLDNGVSTGVIPSPVDNLATIISLLYSQQTPHPGVVFNKNLINDAGGYLEDDFPVEDLSLWLRASRVGKLVSVPEVLLKYRISNTSTSGSRQTEAKSKTLILIQKYGLPINFIKQNFDELSGTYQNYSKLPFSIERRLLFMRNMNMLYKVAPQLSRFSNSSYPIYIFRNPVTVLIFIKQKLRRLIYRKFNF